MTHSEEWHAFRRQGIGGSDANTIMGGDPEKILRLWKEKRGEIEPEDLSKVLPVRMGSFTEPLNIQWFEEHTGKVVTHNGDQRVSDEHPFMRCTLDGMVGDDCVFEAKHVSAFAREDEILGRYFPQLQHNMLVTGANFAILSVFYGTLKYELAQVSAEPIYQAQLVEAERRFWECVQTGEPPVSVEIKAPVEAIRKVDMSSSNSWVFHATSWVSNKTAAKAFTDASAELKKLIEDDVVEAYGAGIRAKRSKSGSITISEMK